MSLPKVSIVIPSYKPGHFEQCLRSAIGQTYLNTEILVSDNCPTEAIREICARFPSVIYQRNTAVRTDNVISTLFSGKGKYIKPLFDDDLLHPFAIERMVAAMESRPEVQLVFSRSSQINAANARTEDRRPFQQEGLVAGCDLIRMMTLGFKNVVGEFSTVMVRREQLWKLGSRHIFTFGSKDFLLGLADVALYFALIEDANAYYYDEELSYFRYDMSAGSNSNPAANPDFGHVVADWVELLIEVKNKNLISADEFIAAKIHVDRFMAAFGVFSEMQHANVRYLQLCEDYRKAEPNS